MLAFRYATSDAIVSGMAVVLFRHAHRAGLLIRQMSEEIFRWGAGLSLSPLAFLRALDPARLREHDVGRRQLVS